MKTIKGYKFIEKNMESQNGDCLWELGKWKKHEGKLELCVSGFHACKTPLQSLEYIYGDRWFIVEARGNFKEEKDDKFVASEMRLIKEIPVKKVLPWFAIACARRSLKQWNKKYPKDKRPLEAIEAAENYLTNPTADNLDKVKNAQSARSAESAQSARSAAWSAQSAARSVWYAARSAAWSAQSARSAAWSAESAWSAAESASEYAAWSAQSARSAQSAWSAAESASEYAERKWQNKMLLKLIKEQVTQDY